MRDWDTLRYVLAIAREGGLSGAARALGVTHATVSRQLDRAEEALGAKLFTRLATGLVLNEAGQAVVARAAAVEAEMLALDLELSARDHGETGLVRLTAPPLMLQSGLAEDLAAFRLSHPGVELELVGNNSILDLHRREADVALRVSRNPAESLWGRVIAQQRAGWYATPEFIAAHEEGIAGGAAPVPVISFTGWEAPLPASLVKQVPGADVALTTDDMVGAMALARAGTAMLRMPCFLGAAHGDLARVPGLGLIDYQPVWVLTHPDLRRVPRISALMRAIADGFAARAALYLGEEKAPQPEGPQG